MTQRHDELSALRAALTDAEAAAVRLSHATRQARTALDRFQQAPAAEPAPVPAPLPPMPKPTAAPAAASAAASAPPAPPKPTGPKWWEDDRAALRIVGGIGALLTLAGVAFLLSIVVTQLGPGGRILLAYAIAVLLGGGAAGLHAIRPTAPGINAVAATAMTTAAITTAVVPNVTGWWGLVTAAIVIAVIAGLALAGAGVRASRFLAIATILVTIGCLLINGSDGTMPGQLVVALATTAIPLAAVLIWRGVAARLPERRQAVPETAAVLLLVVIAGLSAINPAEAWTYAFLFGAVAAVMGWAAFRSFTSALGILVTGVPIAIELFCQPNLEWSATSLAVIIAGAVIGALGAWGLATSPSDPRFLILFYTGPATAAFAAFRLAVTLPLDIGAADVQGGSLAHIPVILGATAYTWWMAVRPAENKAIIMAVWVIAAVVGNHAAVTLTAFAPGYLFENGYSTAALHYPNTVLAGLLFTTVAAGLLMVAARTVAVSAGWALVAGITGMLLTAMPIVLGLTALGVRFSIAHLIVSILWIACAAYLMLGPVRWPKQTSLLAALAITIVAAIKLAFYDMQAMSGWVKVVTFITCGLLLLGGILLRGSREQGDAPAPTPQPGSQRYAQPAQESPRNAWSRPEPGDTLPER